MAKKIKFATNIPWRKFGAAQHITKDGDEYFRTIAFRVVNVIGFCTVYEKRKVKGEVGLRVDFNTYDMPDVDVFICLECSDFVGRIYKIITTPEVDKYLLALNTSGTTYVVRSDTLYDSSPHSFEFDDIAQEDQRLMKLVVDEWSAKFVTSS